MTVANYITVREAAKLCKVCTRTILRAVKSGDLLVRRKAGPTFMFTLREVKDWNNNRPRRA